MPKKREFEIQRGGIVLPLNLESSEIVAFSATRVSRFDQLTPESQRQYGAFLNSITPPKTPDTWKKYLDRSFDADLASGIRPEDSLYSLFPEDVILPHQIVIHALTRLKRANLNTISFLAGSTERAVRSLWIEKTRPLPIALQLAEQMRTASRDLLQLPCDDPFATLLSINQISATRQERTSIRDLPEPLTITSSDLAAGKTSKSGILATGDEGLVPFDLYEEIK